MTASSRQLCVVSGALLGAFLFIFSLQASRAQGQDAAPPGDAPEARLIVTYEEGSAEEAGDGTVGATEVEAEGEIPGVDAEVVSMPEEASAPEDLERAKEKLEEEPGVAAVEYDHAREVAYSPADPGLPEQWGLGKSGFRSAWDGSRGKGVRIAVIDSGISAGHQDLSGKVVAQRDFVNGDATAEDDLGHGTHVAGIAAARTGNRLGISGGCPGCEILVAKTMQGRIGYDSDVAGGIVWAAANGADVINLSLNGPAPSAVLKRAIDYAWNEGAVVVAASGNTGKGTVQYPAAYSAAIAVAATNRSDDRASFSTMGDWVDVAAPGVGVLSTLPGGYGYMNGTSMATPHVAALAGLLASEGLSNQQIKNRIVSNTTDLGPSGRDPYFGTGRIDAARTLRVPAAQPPAPDPEPAPQPDAPADEGGDNQRTLASDEPEPPREEPAPRQDPPPAPPKKPDPPTEPIEAPEPPAEPAEAPEPPPEPAQEEPVVREAPPTAPAPQAAPLPEEPPRELVFQDDEALEARFCQAEQASAAQPATEEECPPRHAAPGADEPGAGLAAAMIDGVLSALHSVLEGLGLVSAAEAEQESAAASAPCAARTADLTGTG